MADGVVSVTVDQELADWMRSRLSQRALFADKTEPISEVKLIPSIKELYGLRQLTAPKVVICQSPLQMRLMPVLFLCPLLDQMFTLPNNTISEQMRAKLTNLIGSELTASLFATFDKNYKSGDEPGEFLIEKNGAFQREDAAFDSDTNSDAVDGQSRMLLLTRYYELRPAVARYWTLFQQIEQYIRELPKDVVVPMEAALQDRVLLQLSMHLKADLNALIRHLSLAQTHDGGSSSMTEFEQLLFDIATERMNQKLPIVESRETLWSAFGEAHLIYPFKKICFVCEFPSKVTRRDGILHAEDDAAVEYRDGMKLHFWRGIRVRPELIEQRSSLTAVQVNAERNMEMRRIMIEMLGPEKFLQDTGAKPIQEDEFGSLYKFGGRLGFGDDITMVRVINSTAESDGSRKVYWLRVPPDVRTAKGAVAWSFNTSEDEYQPVVET